MSYCWNNAYIAWELQPKATRLPFLSEPQCNIRAKEGKGLEHFYSCAARTLIPYFDTAQVIRGEGARNRQQMGFKT